VSKHGDPIIDAFDEALGDRIRDDDIFACDVWSALCNTDWIAPDGGVHSDSFRSAGATVAEIRADGSDYMTWYCSTTAGIVTKEISDAMAALGWRHEPIVYVKRDYSKLWDPKVLLKLAAGWKQ
jgi:hypothetical protein